MTIHLPEDLQSSIRQAVLDGRFSSEDDLVAKAVRDYLSRNRQVTPSSSEPPFLGSMRDSADDLDEIVAEAMRRRREEPWRIVMDE